MTFNVGTSNPISISGTSVNGTGLSLPSGFTSTSPTAGFTVTGSSVNANSSVLGAISTTGEVIIQTGSGNLVLNGNIATTSGNVTLMAGTSSAVAASSMTNGNVTGGDVKKGAGSSITAGAGKTVAIYSGNADSANLSALVTNGTTSRNKAYATNATGGWGTINPNVALNLFYRVSPQLTVTGATAQNKVYDGTSRARVTGTVTGAIDGDVVSGGIIGSFADASAGTNKSVSVTVSNIDVSTGSPTLTVSGYSSGSSFAGLTANIARAAVTIANVTASGKIYDTTTNASIASLGDATVELGNSTSLNGTTAAATTFTGGYTVSGVFQNAAAGAQNVTLSAALADSTNFTVATINSANVTTATIGKANVTIAGVTADDKVYDTTINAAIAGLGSATVTLGDASAANGSLAAATTFTGNYTASGVFQNAAAGVQNVTLSAVLGDTTNYTLASINDTSATIARANVTISGVTVDDKYYDTTTNAAIASHGSATVTLGNASAANGSLAAATNFTGNYTASGVFQNAAAGVQNVTLSAVLADSTNYTVASINSINATIMKANVTISGVAANDKVYDATTNASFNTSNATVSVALGNASAANGSVTTVTNASLLSGVTGAFANAAAGNQTVSLTTALSDTTNYTLASGSQASANATIAKANVTIAGVTVDDKVYDTTTNAAIAGLGSATVTLGNASAANGSLATATNFTGNYTASGVFQNAAAGVQNVTLSAVLADSTNYTVASINSINATIMKANVTISGVAANDKVYDATTNASFNTSNATVSVALGNASAANGSVTTVTNASLLSGVTGAFANAAAGNQTVSLTTALSDTTNYTLASGSQASANATIAKANVTISGVTAHGKVYDTTTNAAIDGLGSATVTLGNASAANGSLASATNFTGNYTASGVFQNAAAGVQNVTLAAVLGDTTNYTLAAINDTTATIAKANVTISGVTAHGKVYDTTTNAAIAGLGSATVTLGNASVANGSLATATNFTGNYTASGVFQNAAAGVQNVTLAAVLTDSANYTVASINDTSATIAKANVTISGVTAHGKVYDTTINAAIDGLGSATVTLGNASAANGSLAAATNFTGNYTASGVFQNAAAGTQNVTLSAALADSTNYTLAAINDTTATIAKANVTISGVVANNKVYDTTTNASFNTSNATVSVALGDASAANGSVTTVTNASLLSGVTGNFANAAAGNQTVSLTTALSDTANYTLDTTSQTSANAMIDKANVTIAGVQVSGKIFDGTTNAAIASQGNATVTLGNASAANGSLAAASGFSGYTASGSFANAAAGVQDVTLAAALTDSTNYTVVSINNANATIAKAAVTIAGIAANDKVYDTTTNASFNTSNATVSVALGDASAADGTTTTVTNASLLSGVTGAFANAAAGNQTVNVTAVLADTTNYTLAGGSQASTSATIGRAQVTLGNVTAQDKIYDGTTNVALGAGSATVQLGDATTANGTLAATSNFANLSIAGGFADAAAGANKAVNLSVALSDTTNYSLSGATQLSTTANIAKANVTISGVTASNKVYDTTTAANLAGVTVTVALGNAAAADGTTVNIANASAATVTGAFANAAAGTQTVTLNTALADTANYTIASGSQVTTTATIGQAAVTIAGIAANDKVYDTTTNASFNTSNATVSVALGDANAADGTTTTVSNASLLSCVTGAFANAAAGGQSVGLTTMLADTTNYTLASASQTTANATIARANVTIAGVVAADKVYDTTVNAAIAGQGTALVTLGDATAADGTIAAATNFTGGYMVSGMFQNAAAGVQNVTLAAALADGVNYSVASVNQGNLTNATIARAQVTLGAITASNKVYDGTTNVVLSAGSATVRLGDATAANGNLAAATSFTDLNVSGGFVDAAAGNAKAVAVNVALGDTGNYSLSGSGQVMIAADIAKALVTITNVTSSDKIYDGARSASIGGDVTVAFGDAATANGTTVSQAMPGIATLQALFDNKNAGVGKTVAWSGYLTDGANFSFASADSGTVTANITPLAKVAWTGQGDGVNWFDPSNWAGGAIPDAANVLDVVLPSGVTVTFNSSVASGAVVAGPVSIRTLDGNAAGLQMQAGGLNSTQGVTLASLDQSGGTIAGAGGLTVARFFKQTGGAIALGGDIALSDSSGQLTFVSLGGRTVNVNASGDLVAGNLTSTGDTMLSSGGNMTFVGLQTVGGNLTGTAGQAIEQAPTSALAVTGWTNLTAGAGGVNLSGNSSLSGTVNVNTTGNASLNTSGNTTLGNVTASGPAAITSSGSVNVTGSLPQGTNITVPPGQNVSGNVTNPGGGGNVTSPLGTSAQILVGALQSGEIIRLEEPAAGDPMGLVTSLPSASKRAEEEDELLRIDGIGVMLPGAAYSRGASAAPPGVR